MSNLIGRTIDFKIKEEIGTGFILEKYNGLSEKLIGLPNGDYGEMMTLMYVPQDFYMVDCKGTLTHVPCGCVTKLHLDRRTQL